MKRYKIIATFFLLVLCAGSIHGARFFFGPRGRVTLDRRILNRSTGNPASSVWVVEYMDYQCPSCALSSKVLDAYLKKYPSSLYLQVRFHPLTQHPHGLESAIYSECATRQNKFWAFHRLLFENQNEWKDLPDVTEKLHGYARLAGLNLKKLDVCIANPHTKEKVLEENADSLTVGVASTPTFFINGKMIVGPKPLAEELKLISPDFTFDFPKVENNAH